MLDRALCNGQQGVGGEACLTDEGAGGLRIEAIDAVAVPVAVVVGKLGGEVAGLRGVVELGGTNQGADDTLNIDTREAEPGGLGLWRLSFRSSLATRPAALEPG